MRLILHKEARAELGGAWNYYSEKDPDLGRRLLEEFEHALNCISDAPQAWPSYGPKTRRYLLKSFPYHVVYHVDRRAILIVAIAHAKRNPSYWQDRMERSRG